MIRCSVEDRYAGAEAGVSELEAEFAAEAEVRVLLEASGAGVFANVYEVGGLDDEGADSVDEGVPRSTAGAHSLGSEGHTKDVDVHASSVGVELSAGAVDFRQTVSVAHHEVSRAVEAGAIVGVEPIASHVSLHADVGRPVQPKATLALELGVVVDAVSENGDQEASVADLAEA